MLNGIDALPLLPEAKWPQVRDISIPLINQGSEAAPSYTADLASSLCFVGTPHAYRLCDPAHPESVPRVIRMVEKVDPTMINGQRRFRLEQDGLSFRVQVGNTATSPDLQLRVLPGETPSVDDLQFLSSWRALMLDQELLNGGLVLVTAPNGQGKTTTASAVVRSRLELYGGMANTVEDPIELPLQGVWGRGVCYQRPADTNFELRRPGEGYYRGMIDALRQFPAISHGCTILYVGEIRDARTAAETLKAASNGHLVIATMHGKSVEASVRRIATLASDNAEGMSYGNVLQMLAESLRLVINQRLIWQLDGQGWSAANVRGQVLFSSGYDSAAGSLIRKDSISGLIPLVESQSEVLDGAFDAAKSNMDKLRGRLAAITG